MHRFLTPAIFIILLLTTFSTAQAQDQPAYPTYIVQSGDTLYSIATQFGTSVDEIIQLNQITNPDAIQIGTELKIPGFEGVHGLLQITPVPLGATLQRLSLQNKVPIDLLTKMNRITSPGEVYVGMNMIIPTLETGQQNSTLTLAPTQSLLELAVLNNENPWTIVERNELVQSWGIIPNDVLYSSRIAGESDSLFMPGVLSISVTPLPLAQGSTAEIRITTTAPMNFTGIIGDRELHFNSPAENEYVALQGISAQAPVGPLNFRITASSVSGDLNSNLQQNILLYPGNFGEDPPLTVDPITIDPQVISSEQEIVDAIVNTFSPDKQWDGVLGYPLDEPCFGSSYGGSRIYNGSYLYYHTGMDFTVCSSNINIYASAPGTVVFAGPLTIRGNAVLIDHGWGVFTGYYHQSEILVQAGDHVDTGQNIGYVGNTGRSTGYHLHWEVWVGGVQVNPIYWLENVYP